MQCPALGPGPRVQAPPHSNTSTLPQKGQRAGFCAVKFSPHSSHPPKHGVGTGRARPRALLRSGTWKRRGAPRACWPASTQAAAPPRPEPRAVADGCGCRAGPSRTKKVLGGTRGRALAGDTEALAVVHHLPLKTAWICRAGLMCLF